ncbi:MAG: dihydroneopterin aldolase [Pseudomonadota bacterium]
MDGNEPLLTAVTADAIAEAAPAPEAARARQQTRRVFVRDLEVLTSVGVYEHEHRYLQRVTVSLSLDVADDYDGRSDDIAHVYDYDEAIGAVRTVLDDGHLNLIETAAERIAEHCLTNRSVKQVTVRIEKPDVVAGCQAVGIEISRGGR